MASREGIALLSMYYDEEDEDVTEEEEQQQKIPLPSSLPEEADVMEVEECESHNNSNAASVVHSDIPIPIEKSPQEPPPQASTSSDQDWESNTRITHVNSTPTPSPVSQPHALPNSAGSLSSEIAPIPLRSKAGPLNIVDYDHDETAISPEKEEGEILSVDHVMTDVEIQNTEGDLEEKTSTISFNVSTSNSQTSFDQPLKQLLVSDAEAEADKDIVVTTTAKGTENSQPDLNASCFVEIIEAADSLKKFLPPPPTKKCSQELQNKIIKFLTLKKTGKSFNAELRKLKDYRNPDFLQHAVRYQGINQTGTCFNKDVFNPEGYDPSDYYDEIEADMKREMERKEQGRKRSPKVEFLSGGPPKFNGVSVPSVSAVPPSGQQSAFVGTASNTRPNKKSKWDKVDSDSRNSIQSGIHESSSSGGGHAGLLSASNAGAGYAAFAYQKRKEAEERKSSEKVGRR